MSLDFRTQKAINFSKWIERVVDKYQVPDGMIRQHAVDFALSMRVNPEKRTQYTSPLFLAVILDSSPYVKMILESARKMYELSSEERAEFVNTTIQDFENLHEDLGKRLAQIKESPDDLCADLRTLGAYVEIFFGPLLDKK